jgi:hypothetical protein
MARGSFAAMPSTDLLDLGGVPFRHVGTRTANLDSGIDVRVGGRNTLSQSVHLQSVQFDRPDELRPGLRGGDIAESLTQYKRRMSPRTSLGGDYMFRRSQVSGDFERFNIHELQGAIDLQLSPAWTFRGAGGVVQLLTTAPIPDVTGPSWRLAIERRRAGSAFTATYIRTYLPSFGIGGTVDSQHADVGLRRPLSRRVYVDQSVMFRDDRPLTNLTNQLPLRSLRTTSSLGWAPSPLFRIEGFYVHAQQNTLQAGGLIERDRVGFQIITSKPMRFR